MRYRFVLLLFVYAATIGILNYTIPANATEFRDMEVTGEVEIPSDFNLSIKDTCSGHSFFYQVSARDDGSFIVCYRQSNSGTSNHEFGMVYIDVFDNDGSFLYELTFFSSQDFAAEYTYDAINLYFYDSVISIENGSENMLAYSIPDEAAISSGVFSNLRATEFDCGNWHYECGKSFHGYTKLTRQDGETLQVLISLPGSGYTIWNTVGLAIILGCGGIAVCFIIRKRKSKNDSTL